MIRAAAFRAIVALLALNSFLAPSASAQEDLTSGLRVASAQFVDVDLGTSTLRVRHEIELRNDLQNRTADGYVERFYFASFSIPVYRGASAVSATRPDGRTLPVSIDEEEGGIIAFATIDLQPDLFAGQSTSFVLTYELGTQPPRTGSLAQINSALATFPLVLSGDPGLASVEVRIPSGDDIEVVGDTLERREENGTVILSATAVADPAAWFATVLVRNDVALVQKDLAYGPHTITLQGWPGDDEWLTATEDLAARGLPALEDVVGYGWDTPRTVDIVETVAPYVYGFAGWYQGTGTEAVIEIGDRLDPHVTLHELAHSWFDSTTFEGRWLNEALADETAALAMADLGMERPVPELTGPDAPGAIPLLDWADPDLASPESEDQEAYGYNASWWIAHQISEEIGSDALREVLVAAHHGRSAYDPDTGRDDVGEGDAIDLGSADWREMLDLVEDVGSSEQAADLWRTFVLDDDGLLELSEREAAREQYQMLLDDGDGWLPPRVLRDQMARWRFDDAAETGGEVAELFEQRDAVAQDFDRWDVELPDSLQRQFEGATELDDARSALVDAEEAATAVHEAEEELDSLGPVERIGLWLEAPSDHVEVAVAALETGSWSQAEQRAELASNAADTALRDGILRLVGLVGLILVAALLLTRLWVHRRRARAT